VGLIKKTEGSFRHKEGILLLINTPIDSCFKLSPYHDFIVNIKNERDFTPTPDRERLKKGDKARLEEELKNLCVKGLESLFDFETLKEFVEKRHKWELYKSLLDSVFIKEQVSYKKKNMINLLYQDMRLYENNDIKPTRKELEDIIKSHKNGLKVFYSTINMESIIRTVLMNNSPCIVILTKNVGLMEKLGFTNIKSISGLGETIGKTKVSVHTSHIGKRGYNSYEEISKTTKTKLLNELLEDSKYFKVIIFRKGISETLDLLSRSLTTYYVTQLKKKQIEWLFKEYKYQKEIGEIVEHKGYESGIITYEDFLEQILEKQYQTTRGLMSGGDILSTQFKIMLHNTCIKETLEYMKNESYLYIPVSSNEQFELKLLMKIHNKKYENFKSEESPKYYCYKCGVGIDGIISRRDYANLMFYAKKKLGEKNQHLYNTLKDVCAYVKEVRDVEQIVKIVFSYAQQNQREITREKESHNTNHKLEFFWCDKK